MVQMRNMPREAAFRDGSFAIVGLGSRVRIEHIHFSSFTISMEFETINT